MAATSDGERIYVVPIPRVRECIDTLLSRDTHPFFIAYLYLRQLAAREGSLRGLKPSWSELGKYLEVPGGPPGKPYLRPFWHRERKTGQEWLNENLAGSFAPSSIRDVPALVVETDAERRYNLRPDHWEAAREHLLFGRPLSVLALAAFLFRDYGFIADSMPTPTDLVQVFRQQFGYSDSDQEEFDRLYDTDWIGADGPWFKIMNEDPGERP